MNNFIVVLLSLLQFLTVTLNLVPLDTNVNYGGTPYEEPVIGEYVTLTEDGSSDYTIVIPEAADAGVRAAAEQLQSYLFKISGAELTVADDTSPVREHEILLGNTSRAVTDVSALGDEGFTIYVAGEKLIIAGGATHGVLYGVFTFLEEQLGCRWWTPTVETVPETPTVRIDAQLNNTQVPSFSVRCNRPSGLNYDTMVYAKNRTNVTFYTNYAFMNDSVDYVLWDVSMPKLVPDSLFDTSPEMFALDGATGERTNKHVCMSSDEAYDIALANAISYIQKSEAKGSYARYIHIGQKDVTVECACPECQAAAQKYGSYSAPVILFCNRLAGDLAAAGYGDYSVTFFAYQETTAPPTGALRCADNVIPVICGSHYSCMVHPWTECGFRDISGNDKFAYRFGDHSDTVFADQLKRWAEVADTTFIYDYTINFTNTQMFLPNLAVIQPNYQYLRDTGITGITYTCGDGHPAAFNELRNYLLSHLMWNVDADVEYLTDEFLAGYYGADAAPYIKEFIDTYIAKTAASAHATNTDWEYQEALFNLSDTEHFDTLWSNALNADVTDEQLYRIEISELSWEVRKANAFMGEYMFINPGRAAAQERLYDNLIAHGIDEISTFAKLPPKESIDFYTSQPVSWR